jgi:FkbM family methyltransferase
MRRRDFVGGVAAGVVAAASGTAAWDQFGPGAVRIPRDARLSFAEQGEDIVLFHALRDVLKVEHPTYLDVGAAHPVRSNNTYLLYTTGGHGVLVEPNPVFVDQLRRVRPRDVVVPAGIGITEDASADYYEIKGNPMLNTFSAEQVERLQKGRTESVLERVVKMPLLSINQVIAEHLRSAPDLLSTDIEGLDYAIIRTLDLSRFRPGVICAEGAGLFASGGRSDIMEYLSSQDYVLRGGSMVNSIFIDQRRLTA